jgi:hypothetical protein
MLNPKSYYYQPYLNSDNCEKIYHNHHDDMCSRYNGEGGKRKFSRQEIIELREEGLIKNPACNI